MSHRQGFFTSYERLSQKISNQKLISEELPKWITAHEGNWINNSIFLGQEEKINLPCMKLARHIFGGYILWKQEIKKWTSCTALSKYWSPFNQTLIFLMINIVHCKFKQKTKIYFRMHSPKCYGDMVLHRHRLRDPQWHPMICMHLRQTSLFLYAKWKHSRGIQEPLIFCTILLKYNLQ